MTDQESTTEPTPSRSFGNSGLTYSQVARELGIAWCLGCDQWKTNHGEGSTTIFPLNEAMIHWTDRKMTRRGLYRFLLLSAPLVEPSMVSGNRDWLNLYFACKAVLRMSAMLNVRFPRSYSSTSRARVRLWLKRDLRDTQIVLTTEEKAFIRRIQLWARA
jgi:hypothetical protein